MSQVELKVDGMTCGGCVASVKKALGAVSGVQSVEVDLASGRVAVEGEALDRQALDAAVEAAGFDVVG
ncbi:heavy metal-associated domain-containing protein [Crenobacter sp. SG2303]|uniref:Heavy metal-associated domain-containing protein n=1 Tax=Crenobacter oryzisoli TaxID=3056844 RepID=A0ABT7XI09_9NEIS|nr:MULTISPECIES: heavy metal-associated domain-containing protein [unclassified Crenobacter]MDN0073408.1 heavy metal-associated domain-containing protein [Crenobacter sp. SG2303]MDN0083324.1 heavy metal-associated domain-containing protein [Crenobacter sp. SG2305]